MRMEPPGAWWNVTSDPWEEGQPSPLWAFARHRALNRLALRTKLRISSVDPPSSVTDGGALAYLKHDALGPHGDACLMLFNPGAAQRITLDLSPLAPSLPAIAPHDLFAPTNSSGLPPPPPLASSWSLAMGAGEFKAFGGFSLGSFAPRQGKVEACVADDAWLRPGQGSTLQGPLLPSVTRRDPPTLAAVSAPPLCAASTAPPAAHAWQLASSSAWRSLAVRTSTSPTRAASPGSASPCRLSPAHSSAPSPTRPPRAAPAPALSSESSAKAGRPPRPRRRRSPPPRRRRLRRPCRRRRRRRCRRV